MAIEKVDGRELNWRTLFPWTELFRGFQVALDLNKLFLAAAGIVVMALGWWLLSVIFGSAYSNKPDWPANYIDEAKGTRSLAWTNFRRDREQWNLMHETAGVGPAVDGYEAQDLADSPEELETVGPALKAATKEAKQKTIDQLEAEVEKKRAEMRTLRAELSDPELCRQGQD